MELSNQVTITLDIKVKSRHSKFKAEYIRLEVKHIETKVSNTVDIVVRHIKFKVGTMTKHIRVEGCKFNTKLEERIVSIMSKVTDIGIRVRASIGSLALCMKFLMVETQLGFDTQLTVNYRMFLRDQQQHIEVIKDKQVLLKRTKGLIEDKMVDCKKLALVNSIIRVSNIEELIAIITIEEHIAHYKKGFIGLMDIVDQPCFDIFIKSYIISNI